jgi:hypothetical protein
MADTHDHRRLPAAGRDCRLLVLHAANYFPIEQPVRGEANVPGLDAAFTSQATINALPAGLQGTSVVDGRLAIGRIQAPDVRPLAAGLNEFANSVALTTQNIVPQTTAPTALAGIESDWRAMAVPVTLTTLTLLLLTWLLLFLIVTEAVEARGPEIALAKLRGHGRLGILLFGLSEPAVILLAALPVGLLVGWTAARRPANPGRGRPHRDRRPESCRHRAVRFGEDELAGNTRRAVGPHRGHRAD